MEKLILIDGNSLINRAFYAMPPLLTKDGAPTNGVFGFVNMLVKLIQEENPTYLTVAFDVHAPTFRHKMFDEYKGTRKPMPEDLRPQIPLLKEVLKLMNISAIELKGYEADDIIGTIAKSTSVKTIIITGDKDSFQLVDKETEVHFTKRGITDIDVLSDDNFKEKTGITPCQVIDLKALMGDSSDNIPGVAGVGEKTALSLIETFGTVDNLYKNLDKVKGKLKEKLENSEELCRLSRTLATIDTNAPIDVDLEKMRVSFPFDEALKRKFIELEFKALAKKDELFVTKSPLISGEESTETTTEIKKATVKEIADGSVLKSLADKDKLCIIIDRKVYLNAFDDIEYVVKVKENFLDDGVSVEDLTAFFKTVFESEKHLTVFNKKAMRHLLKNYGVEFTAPCDDVSIMKYLADFTGKDETLYDIVLDYNLDVNALSYSLGKIKEMLVAKLEIEGMGKLYKEVELPLADVLFDMEVEGFKVDINTLNILSEKYTVELKVLEDEIFTCAGERFNVNSPKQLGVVLFEKLKLKTNKKTKTGYSTSAEVLDTLTDAHKIVPLILKYRQKQKLLSTYIEGFRPLIEKSTGLIHTKFNQTVTTTGRLSSSEPNLQNIPIRDDEGKEIRKFFIPRDESHVLVGADYSQIELRLLAHFSGCKALIDAYNNGEDIHALTASQVFGVLLSEVDEHIRRSAKAVNFGIIYGISEFGLAKNLKISPKVAKEYIKTYFEKYPEVRAYMDENVRKAKETGHVSTLLNRKRYIREINSPNFNVRAFGERAAMNMPLQGSSADIIKLAMISVFNRIKEEGLKSKLILQVHDELIVDALKSEEERIKQILKEEMEGVVKLKVPLTVNVGAGKTLFDAK